MGIKCACGCGKEVSAKAAANGWKYCMGHKPKNGQKAAGGGQKLQRKTATRDAKDPTTDELIACLRKKRDALTRAIEAFE